MSLNPPDTKSLLYSLDEIKKAFRPTPADVPKQRASMLQKGISRAIRFREEKKREQIYSNKKGERERKNM